MKKIPMSPAELARRSTRGTTSSARKDALERLKALRRCGHRQMDDGGFQLKLEQPIYDTVIEDEYEVLVAKRREELKDFIIDDEGSGYGDEGQEDWSIPGSAVSSEESDKPKTKNRNSISAKNDKGKQRITSTFTSSVFKKDLQQIFSRNSIVDDVIAEFAPDESDREKRRKKSSSNSAVNNSKIEKPIVSSLSLDAVNGSISYPDVNCETQDDNIHIAERGTISEDMIRNEVIEDNSEEECLLNQSDVKELERKACDEVKDPAPSATVGRQPMRSVHEENLDFEVESDGSLPFYILDAHEELYGVNAGNVYLFGKVKSGAAYHSCCVVVKNMKRCVYAIPTVSFLHNDTITEPEKNVEESQTARTRLNELATDLKTEMTKELRKRKIEEYRMTLVKRNYAFDRSGIPHGENYVLKISYPFKDPPLPSDFKGSHLRALLGTHNSALELFLIKRKVKGPSWLSISKFSSATSKRESWCNFEVTVDSPKDIQVLTSSKHKPDIPPVVVTAINLKTIINEKRNVNEIVSASVICCHRAKIDIPMVTSDWARPGMLSHFTVIRELEGGISLGLKKEAVKKSAKAVSSVVCYESNETALLNRLMTELQKLDSDVLVGHNISGFDLDVLLHRVQACKVQSKIGRLKHAAMPKLDKRSSFFGSGVSPGIMSCIAGRLLCDTLICSRDLLKEVSYSLTQLAKTQLNKDRKEITPHDIPQMFQSPESLMELIDYGETDAWLSLELMFHLSVLPLTRQLTNISGNLWHKTLQGARAHRVEYLLLHAFHAEKFIVPDKCSSQSKDTTRTTKRKINTCVGSNEIDPDDTICDNELPENHHGKTKNGPSYSGGLVLQPKKGLYDKYTLLLDFNSLYPSIIQEYNICFTTVERSGPVPRLPSNKRTGVLPKLLENLVERRRRVKTCLKTASGLRVQQLDIQQQALKLTANSIYGCLGFSNSRFYAKPLAELITLQGREILQSTVNLVQDSLNLEVIYGDTDSIMIYSGHDDIGKAKSIARKVIQEVNKKYRCLEIDLDALYKRMLLLKKKKYAAVKIQFTDGKPYEVIERKGLDMVRRDWSLLSKELGDFCLGQILSGRSREDVVEAIHNSLMKVQEEMRKGQIPLEKYVITKTLTKPPEAYRDARNQPHVQVALSLNRRGYVTGCSAGDAVPYIICCAQGNGSTSSVGIAQRARHPDEFKGDNESWIIDIDYYLAQQIHPVISRLCASIQGTSPSRLAYCLGLDPSKFQNKLSESFSNDTSNFASHMERYRGCEPLILSCPWCSGSFECAPILNSVCILMNTKPADIQAESSNDFWHKLRCPKCPDEGDKGVISPAIIANQVKRQTERFISMYYKGLMMCDDETCNYSARGVNLRALGDCVTGTTCPNHPPCSGHLIRKYTEAQLYRQLLYFCYTLDTVWCIEKIEGDIKVLVEKELARIRPLVETAALTVQKNRDRCAYGWIQLKDLFVSCSM